MCMCVSFSLNGPAGQKHCQRPSSPRLSIEDGYHGDGRVANLDAKGVVSETDKTTLKHAMECSQARLLSGGR
jgi:hypothetical protein